MPSGLEVHGAQLPALSGVFHAVLKTVLLFFIAHREPILDQDDARTHQHALELRAPVQEFEILAFAAETHHALHSSPVVPTAIEQDHLTGSRQMCHIALEIPLRLFAFGGSAQGDHATDARIQTVGDPLDRAAFPCCVASLEWPPVSARSEEHTSELSHL